MRRYRNELLLGFAFAVLVFLVFGRALHAELLPWDDDINIYENPYLGSPSLERIFWMFTDFSYQWRYQPLSWLTWSIIYAFNGFAPFGYHLINLVLHSLNTLLVFLLIRQLLNLTLPKSKESPSALLTCSALATAFWAFHPLKVETVAWAVELLYNQALFFLLLAALGYLQAAINPVGTARHRWFYWGAVITFSASLLSFPLGLGFVAVCLVLDAYPLARFREGWLSAAARRVWWEKTPFVAVTLFSVIANLYCRTHTVGPWPKTATLADFGFLPRVMQSFYIWAYYVWRPLVPFHLSPIYPELIEFDPWSFPFLASAVFVIGLTMALFHYRRRWPLGISLWICHLALLVPMLGLTEHPHFASDRYSLIESVCWTVLLAAALWQLWEQAAWRKAIVTVSFLLLGLLSYLSFQQTRIWLNRFAFFDRALETLGTNPYAYHIHSAAGLHYFNRGDFLQAERHLQAAVHLNPEKAAVHFSLAQVLYREGKLSEALAETRATLQKKPHFQSAHVLSGEILLALNQPREAEAEYRAELETTPGHPLARVGLSIALAAQNKIEAAIAAYQEAARLTPTGSPPQQHIAFFKTMANAYEKAGNPAMAAQMLQKALTIARDATDTALIQELEQRLQTLSVRPASGK